MKVEIWTFFIKGVSKWSRSKLCNFFLFLVNIGVKKVFCTIVDRKQVTLDYKKHLLLMAAKCYFSKVARWTFFRIV